MDKAVIEKNDLSDDTDFESIVNRLYNNEAYCGEDKGMKSCETRGHLTTQETEVTSSK
jgi:hypothetical protein